MARDLGAAQVRRSSRPDTAVVAAGPSIVGDLAGSAGRQEPTCDDNMEPMSLSGRTISRLAQPFEGGLGPSHGTIERIWETEDAAEYLGEGNKMERVLNGLRHLRDGRRSSFGKTALPPDASKLDE